MVSREEAIENLRLNLEETRSKKYRQTDSLSSKVYSLLLQMLINKDLPPGTVLNRRDIAKQIGVSVAPVLEAFIQLELEGYLITIPRKGTMVTTFGLKEIYEQLVVREALECQAARLYCGKRIRNNYDHLLELGDAIDSTLSGVQSNWEMEYVFHETLVSLSECSLLINVFSRIIRLGTFYKMYNIYSSPGKDRVVDRHKKLLTLLADDNPDIAEKGIREHLRTTKLMLLDEFRKSGMTVPEMEG